MDSCPVLSRTEVLQLTFILQPLDTSYVLWAIFILITHVYFLIFQVRTILDIGCGYGSFGAHLFSKQLITICIANYEPSGSQVQLTLERGLPAMIGSFNSNQLPYPSLSFDMLHCARCGIDWDLKGMSSDVLANDHCGHYVGRVWI